MSGIFGVPAALLTGVLVLVLAVVRFKPHHRMRLLKRLIHKIAKMYSRLDMRAKVKQVRAAARTRSPLTPPGLRRSP